MTRGFTRRSFLKTAASGLVGMSALPSLPEGDPFRSPKLGQRPLGTTGLRVSLLGLGCVALGSQRLTMEDGVSIVEACLDGGITYIDCASTYGDAELKVGEVMRARRSEVVLATKTLERERERAWEEINRSLERLQTQKVDVLQIHAVNRLEDLDRVMAPEGSLAAALRARDEGMCSHIGITGHTRPEVILEALRRYDFATTLVPLSSTDALVSDFGKELFPVARDKRFGIIAMKVLSAGRVTGHVRESISYALSLPISAAVVGMGSLEEVALNIAVARDPLEMGAAERETLEQATRPDATTSVLWWKRR